MPRHGRLALITATASLALVAEARSAEPKPPSPTRGQSAATPLQDDATLHDVHFVGDDLGWAVGDRGVIWKTDDGGRTWQLLDSPVDVALRSVCFLTDRVGWIVGGGTEPFTRLSSGVVLFTRDGGRTWHVYAGLNPSQVPGADPGGSIPRLHFVKFFGRREGVAVGEPSPDHPTGVLRTEDGGQTWSAVDGHRYGNWQAADFTTPDAGVVAGRQGRTTLVGNGKVLPPRMPPFGLRGLHDVHLQSDRTGWLVGDGGLVLRTDNGGLVWRSPPTPLPDELRSTVDFQAVAVHGSKLWIAGQPGSVIWHSPDGGRTWTPQFTGETVPIHALEFSSARTGWAVGAMGLILRTDDGGETWQAVRGKDRRAALMAVHARPSRISFALLAKYSGELGYRSTVLLPFRRDLGPDGTDDEHLDVRLSDAVTAAGGSAGLIGWRLPVTIPGIERDAEKLIAHWNRRTEGRLRDVFLDKLVAELRTWRPSIVVLDQPPSDDAATALLNDAVLHAVRAAADPTRFGHHRERAGLEPWSVQRVYERLPAGSTGDVPLDLYELLPRVGTTVNAAALAARRRLTPVRRDASTREAYRVILDRTGENTTSRPAARDFFIGIPLSPGSAARRSLTPVEGDDLAARQKLARRQRNFQAYAERFLDDPRHSNQLIAQLKEITAGMDDEQSALQLLGLAEEYRQQARWDLAEQTMLELVERHPEQPASRQAMLWLLKWWSGAEPTWQRMRRRRGRAAEFTPNADGLAQRVRQALHAANSTDRSASGAESPLGPDPWRFAQDRGLFTVSGQSDWHTATVRRWHEQALRIASLIRKTAPALYRTPEVRFPLSALLRKRSAHGLADRFYRKLERTGTETPWRNAAAAELWQIHPVNAPPKETLTCRPAQEPPVLDAVLSDSCWQGADEIPLLPADADAPPDGEPYAFAMLSHDAEYLYFAVTVPRSPEAPDAPPVLAGRTHDADLAGFDRVGLFLDVDRDYATHYAFHVDQRGWTAESCWEDQSWNPQWYVAADADGDRWRIEAAIPMRELVPQAPGGGHMWAVGIVRTIPAVGLQSWSHPASPEPGPSTFGLVRFAGPE